MPRKAGICEAEDNILGHVVGDGVLRMEAAKIQGIQEWKYQEVSELWSFLGFVNYYLKFIQGYFSITSPLTDILKKTKMCEWNIDYQRVFELLKQADMEKPVLAFLDHSKPYEVYIDASNFEATQVPNKRTNRTSYQAKL